MSESTDRIEKTTVLRAPIDRVWRAISDSKEFGSWFGMRVDGPFVAGQRVVGRIAPTQVDAEVARMQAPHEGKAFELFVERVEPKRLFSFRWHPNAVDPAVDYSSEPTTLVEFALEEVAGGTKLTITESGFDRIPLARRAAAFSGNDHGWTIQARMIEQHLTRAERG